jgi:hypothetical protein
MWNVNHYKSTSNTFILDFIVNQNKQNSGGSKPLCYLPSSENDTEPKSIVIIGDGYNDTVDVLSRVSFCSKANI